ncbi:MAG TPA: ABC transporter permease subunit [Rariglobus sp.]|jgi:NitT/TauT family transport system permease protein|nr:ABC transporter permease subunit [Rariglobus sp.]
MSQPNRPARRANLMIDAVVLIGLVSLVFGAAHVVGEWRQPLHSTVKIDLSPAALPSYALYSFARGWIAYFLSLVFTLVVASWAFYDTRAQRFILPALDVLQSIPVLGFLPGLVLALVALFPNSNVGLELACVLMIFTGQVWNMTFSYYDSLRGSPPDFRALGRLYDFSWWRRFWKIELPGGAQGLIYNSMVSMAGGWFFLSITESFQLGTRDFRVPGIGSYMSVAIAEGDVRAQIAGVLTMGIVIVAVDRLVWWPLVLWSRKFNLDDFGGTQASKSRLSLWMARSQAVQKFSQAMGRLGARLIRPKHAPHMATSSSLPAAGAPPRTGFGRWLYRIFLALTIVVLAFGFVRITQLLMRVQFSDWREIGFDSAVTFGRVLAAVGLGTIWAVPAGIWIGLNPKLSSRLQPFIQFAASFPAPMIYPWILLLVIKLGGSLQWGAIPLIMLGTQWYILFNVTAAASAIPNDIRSCSDILRLNGWRRWWRYLLPAVAPGLVTGWITAAGGAWNATIVSEYVHTGGKLYEATGLGAFISRATDTGNFPKLTAAVLVMAVIVVGINRTVWKKLQTLANDRCRFGT